MKTKKQKSKQRRRYGKDYPVEINRLLDAVKKSGVPGVVVAALIQVPYGTSYKYLRMERRIVDERIVKRMVVVTDMLNQMVSEGYFPLEKEVSKRKRVSVIYELIDLFVQSRRSEQQ